MNLIFYISLIIISPFLPNKPQTKPVDLCHLYGSIYVETQNRNWADIAVYIDNQNSFPVMKVYLQENQLYADRPGHWYYTKDRSLADFIIYIEKEEGRTRNVIAYTDIEFQAGCQ